MRELTLSLYQLLPPWGRSAVASLRGGYLRRWRYGLETDALIEKYLDREHWPAEKWRQWVEERTAHVLERAARSVPYYRHQWQERRRKGDRAAWDLLANWPILEKETVRTRGRELVADGLNPSRMFHEHTSGTTGTPLDLWWSRRTVRAWYAMAEARCRRWHGISRKDRWAIFGGQVVVPFRQKQPPYWVWNAPMGQLYCSAYHLSPAAIPSYVAALRNYGVDYLLGYTSALYELGSGVIDGGGTLPMRVVLSNAEPVYPHQRQVIETAFTCPLRESYGMAEIVAAASECGSGSLHWWPDAGMVEPGAPGESGESGIIATGLLNDDMPLIRYRVGDSFVPSSQARCGCGRTLPLVGSIAGRNDDILLAADGRAVGRMDPVFKVQLPIREAQIVQESLQQIHVRVVPARGYGPGAESAIRHRIRERLGAVSVTIEEMPSIPRDSRGKFRAVVGIAAHVNR